MTGPTYIAEREPASPLILCPLRDEVSSARRANDARCVMGIDAATDHGNVAAAPAPHARGTPPMLSTESDRRGERSSCYPAGR